MNNWYKEDLAYIHDIGFRSYVLQAMPGILAILNQHGIQVETGNYYGQFALSHAHVAFVAKKPLTSN